MKQSQFNLFKRIFGQKRYRKYILRYKLPSSLYKIYIKDKSQFITEHFVLREHAIFVYNGKFYKRCKISLARVGHRFGEFIRTKKQTSLIHKTRKNQKKAQKMYMKAHGMLKKQRRTK